MDISELDPNPIKAVVIANRAGCPLISAILTPLFNLELLTGFISAIGLFGDEVLQQIEEITIKGYKVEIFVAFNHGLFILAVLDSSAPKGNVREEAEKALDAFYNQYQEEIAEWNGDACQFEAFEVQLREQIEEYVQSLQNSPEEIHRGSLLEKMFEWFAGKKES
ncbi:MAG TPA: hypothetical protein VKK79_10535 [Candidatus Lokiarchaeia archaeon]|nr:hypothetical protein [Candidatus Lokiarchaeia archaeon]